MQKPDAKVSTRSTSKSTSEPTTPDEPSLQSLDKKLNVILMSMQSQSKDIKDIKHEQKELGCSIELCHKSVADISARIDTQDKRLADCHSEVEVMRRENVSLKMRIDSLEGQLNQQAQYSHRNCLIINGVPEDNNENILGVVRRVAVAIRFQDWDDSLLDAVHRLGKNTNSPRPIIIKFVRRLDKNEFLRKKKVKKP